MPSCLFSTPVVIPLHHPHSTFTPSSSLHPHSIIPTPPSLHHPHSTFTPSSHSTLTPSSSLHPHSIIHYTLTPSSTTPALCHIHSLYHIHSIHSTITPITSPNRIHSTTCTLPTPTLSLHPQHPSITPTPLHSTSPSHPHPLPISPYMYLQPERINVCTKSYDVRADVWSLGISLVELATGSSPYSKERFHTEFALLSHIVDAPPPLLDRTKFSPEFFDFVAQWCVCVCVCVCVYVCVCMCVNSNGL